MHSDAALVRACLGLLAASRAGWVIVNLEDLWREADPQNVPGTGPQRPNWSRRSRYTLETFSKMPLVLDLLGEISRRRKARAFQREV